MYHQSRTSSLLCFSLAAINSLLFPNFASASEADLRLPDLANSPILGVPGLGYSILSCGLGVCILGLVFGFVMMRRLKNLPVHKSMLDVSELIFETCKTYLYTQGKFLLMLFAFLAATIIFYFGALRHFDTFKVSVIIFMTIIGMAGSYGVAWFGMRINTYANSRTSFASLMGKPYPVYAIPLQAGMSVGMLLISVELLIMLAIMLFIPGDYAGPCFIGFALGESLGAATLRIAGGIFTKIADIGSDLMKIAFKIDEDDARNPGVIADCAGDNAGDSVGPTADGFETYGVTGVALVTFIALAVSDLNVQAQLLVWIFAMRIGMIATSVLGYWLNQIYTHTKYLTSDKIDFEHPLTTLVWTTSLISIAATFLLSYALIPNIQGHTNIWWQLAVIISCGTLAGALIPELVKIFTSTKSKHVREIVAASNEGGASLNILSGFVAGNFSAYWMGFAIIAFMSIAYAMSTMGIDSIMQSAAVFSFGLVAFGFLGMGPVTIAVDSYGPVADNAQSVYQLSLIETTTGIKTDIKNTFNFEPNFAKAREYLEQNDGAGNTFKATAKPVLIGTAVVGSTTLIFSIIVMLSKVYPDVYIRSLSMLNPAFLLGLIAGGAVIFWFTGAATQAVSSGAYQAVHYIKANMNLTGLEKASIDVSKKVVEICTQFAQRGTINIFLAVFFVTLAFACADAFCFIGYLISIAIFGLYQAVFMANSGGAWDNAKKIVETELCAKGSALHDASIVGDTVGDPFKDTSSVSMNPIIKFTTLFGLLAVELAIEIPRSLGASLAAVFFAISVAFVWRSFYSMRIMTTVDEAYTKDTEEIGVLEASASLASMLTIDSIKKGYAAEMSVAEKLPNIVDGSVME